ncbi:MAG: hypothetical protein IJZ46_01265 [Bacilli bacterium]|nr:hypothetical protein [Bacilli bacterium]
MKKILILSLTLFLCVGCMRIDNVTNLDFIVDEVISTNKDFVNTASLGYKYYLPTDVSKVYDKDYNQKFKVDDVYMYLYVDAVSYYYRNSLNFSLENENNYYYRKINNAEKIGYIKITEEEDRYFLKMVYNYAKIESYVPKTKLNNILTYSMVILDSIEYNNNLIEKILEDEYFSSVDEEYQIQKPEDAESKFSEYLSEYVQEEESVIPDLPEY